MKAHPRVVSRGARHIRRGRCPSSPSAQVLRERSPMPKPRGHDARQHGLPPPYHEEGEPPGVGRAGE